MCKSAQALVLAQGHVIPVLLRCLAVVAVVLFSFAARTHAEDFQARLDRAGIAFELPREGKAILVNIPAFELIAFEDGAPVLRSRLIVGAPWHRTPRLKTFVSAVRFRPTWRPTPSMIASGEYTNRVWPPGERNPLGLAAVEVATGLAGLSARRQSQRVVREGQSRIVPRLRPG